jgi:hypothetical protein
MKKWSYFLDSENNKSRSSILDGKNFNRSLSGVYFEFNINLSGELKVEIESDQYMFYKRKLSVLYDGVLDTCLRLSEHKSYSFYNEVTFNNCKLVGKVSAKISK